MSTALSATKPGRGAAQPVTRARLSRRPADKKSCVGTQRDAGEIQTFLKKIR